MNISLFNNPHNVLDITNRILKQNYGVGTVGTNIIKVTKYVDIFKYITS